MKETFTLTTVQELRDRTGLGLMACKQALIEAKGNIDTAIELLRKKNAIAAEKRGANKTSQGIVHSYIHTGARIGVLLELQCETDFVANTNEMKVLAQDIAMHIVANKPKYVSIDAIAAEVVEKEKEIYREQLQQEKKPAAIIDSIIEGKVKKFFSEQCLVLQPFVKNDSITVAERIQEVIAKVGENIRVGKFARFEIGAL